MANTLPDIVVPSGTWVDVYSATQLTAGTPLIIKNRSSRFMLVFVGPQAPAVSDFIGWDIDPSDWVRVTTVPANSKVWVKGSGFACVQVDD